MPGWKTDELDAIDRAREVELTTVRRDGTSCRSVIVWVVRQGDGIYVRSWLGREAAWFRGALRRPEGRLQVGDRDLPVAFVGVDDAPTALLDAAYREKYRAYGGSYVDHMVSPRAQAATVKLVPPGGEAVTT